MRRLLSLVSVGICLLAVSVHAAEPPAFDSRPNGPFSPEKSQSRFVLPDDLTIEVAAAEPDVVDPVDVRFDEKGRMWVVEMRDYPLGPARGGPPSSRIVTLTDEDGDGRYTNPVVFADGLLFATGVLPWKNGAIVTLSGKIVFFRDTDGDGKSDEEEVLLQGFAEKNTQLRANHPRFAIDNHIYVANGLMGGKIERPGDPDGKVVDISGRDLRFDPLTMEFEAVSGNGQFGMCFDDFGNRFVCSNRMPLQHIVIEERWLKDVVGYAVPSVVQDVAASAERSKLFPISKTWTTSNLHEGQFTAACGVNFYRGDALPATYKGLAFTCDPTGNLVHAERLTQVGPTFVSQPLFEGKEFLATVDEWFRPVSVENGPDGNLYIVDMYRAVIEHPEWVPDELKNRPDERWGDDRGRIWRIKGKSKTRPRAAAKLAELDGASLRKLLDDPNAWRRETARRLLVQRGEKVVAKERLVSTSVIEASTFDLRAFSTELDDPTAGMWKTRLALLEAGKSEHPHTLATLVKRIGDDDCSAPIASLVEEMATVWAARKPWLSAEIGEEDRELLRAAAAPTMIATRLVVGLCNGLAKRSEGLSANLTAVSKFESSLAQPMLTTRLLAIATNATAHPRDRIKSIDILANFPDHASAIAPLASAEPDASVRGAALRAFARHGDLETWKTLIAGVKSQGPGAARAIFDGALANLDRTQALLTMVESEALAAAVVDPLTTQRLMQHGDPGVKQRATKLWAPASGPEREALYAKYKEALAADPQPKRGQTVFQKNCAQCHKIGDLGVQVGPDISDLRTKSLEQILLDVLEPNRAIDANFVGYTCATNDGRTFTGVLGGESANSVTIKQAQGQVVTLARDEIEELVPTGKSLMPEGIERVIPPGDMADVVAFVKGWRYLDGRIPGK